MEKRKNNKKTDFDDARRQKKTNDNLEKKSYRKKDTSFMKDLANGLLDYDDYMEQLDMEDYS